MKARQIIENGVSQNVVVVYEAGTTDPFTALYINDNLIVTSVRMEVMDVLTALNIVPHQVFIPKGFDGHFPQKLNQLRLLKPK